MKKIILHIGYNKTGTTAIQKSFFNNRKQLLKDGLFYPEKCRGERKSPAHHSLAESLLFRIKKPLPRFVKTEIYSKFPAEYYWDILKQEIYESECSSVFISSEAFSRLRGHPEQMKIIREQLKEYPVKILVYLRNQPDFLASAYNQAVKRGHETRTVDDLMQTGWMSIDYFQELEDWASVFGTKNMIVRIFDQKKMTSGVVADLIKSLKDEGISINTANWRGRSFNFRWNIRLPDNMIETKRKINAKFRLPVFFDMMVNFCLSLAGRYYPPFELLTQEQKEEFRKQFQNGNKMLGDKYFNGKEPFSYMKCKE